MCVLLDSPALLLLLTLLCVMQQLIRTISLPHQHPSQLKSKAQSV